MTEKQIRKPKQSRSIQMKEKILDTAFTLFCDKGYYQTTTNEIAKIADVSIGSLYSYFKDKDTIFLEILKRHHQQFATLHDELLNQPELYQADKRVWLRHLIESLITLHENFKGLYKEMHVLYYANPNVAAIMDEQMEDSRQSTMRFFQLWRDELKVTDLEAAAVITFEFISAIVDQIVFGKNTIDRERIIQTGVEALARFLIDDKL
jgi:AcrR family transcriptional regulator